MRLRAVLNCCCYFFLCTILYFLLFLLFLFFSLMLFMVVILYCFARTIISNLRSLHYKYYGIVCGAFQIYAQQQLLYNLLISLLILFFHSVSPLLAYLSLFIFFSSISSFYPLHNYSHSKSKDPPDKLKSLIRC